VQILEVADPAADFVMANKRRIRYTRQRGRRQKARALIAACILAARKLMQWDGRNSPASESAIADAIALAERIMAKIDAHWPARL